LQAAAENKKVARSASLPLTKAMWEYCCEARWIIFAFSLFFFLSAQASRQVCACVCCGLAWLVLCTPVCCPQPALRSLDLSLPARLPCHRSPITSSAGGHATSSTSTTPPALASAAPTSTSSGER
jgi:hypothetical protein